MKRIFLYILAAANLALLPSCSKIEPEVTIVDQRIVILSSIGGMGDHGYNDLVISGLMKSYWARGRFDAHMFDLGPESMEEAEAFVERWTGPVETINCIGKNEDGTPCNYPMFFP